MDSGAQYTTPFEGLILGWLLYGFVIRNLCLFLSNSLEFPGLQTFGIFDGILAGEKQADLHHLFPASIKTELLQQASCKFSLLNLLGAPCQE